MFNFPYFVLPYERGILTNVISLHSGLQEKTIP